MFVFKQLVTETARHGQVWQACHKISKCESAKKPKVCRTRLEICHIWNPSSFTTWDEETWRTQPQFSTTCYECIKSDFQKAVFPMKIWESSRRHWDPREAWSTYAAPLVALLTGCCWLRLESSNGQHITIQFLWTTAAGTINGNWSTFHYCISATQGEICVI